MRIFSSLAVASPPAFLTCYARIYKQKAYGNKQTCCNISFSDIFFCVCMKFTSKRRDAALLYLLVTSIWGYFGKFQCKMNKYDEFVKSLIGRRKIWTKLCGTFFQSVSDFRLFKNVCKHRTYACWDMALCLLTFFNSICNRASVYSFQNTNGTWFSFFSDSNFFKYLHFESLHSVFPYKNVKKVSQNCLNCKKILLWILFCASSNVSHQIKFRILLKPFSSRMFQQIIKIKLSLSFSRFQFAIVTENLSNWLYW